MKFSRAHQLHLSGKQYYDNRTLVVIEAVVASFRVFALSVIPSKCHQCSRVGDG